MRPPSVPLRLTALLVTLAAIAVLPAAAGAQAPPAGLCVAVCTSDGILPPQNQGPIAPAPPDDPIGTAKPPPPEVCFAGGDAQASEGDTGSSELQLQVTLSEPSKRTVEVDWYDTGHGGDGDYRADGGHLVFQPGETSKTATVVVFGDTAPESDEAYVLSLRAPVHATLCDSPDARFVIVDDDTRDAPAPAPETAGAPPSTPTGTSDGATGTPGLPTGLFDLSLASSRLTGSGRVLLRLTCPEGQRRCGGALSLQTGSHLAGRAPFSLDAGDSQVVGVRLTRRARRLLAGSREVVLTDGATKATVKSVTRFPLLTRFKPWMVSLHSHLSVFLCNPDNYNKPVDQMSQLEAEIAILCLINDARAQAGLPPLTLNPALTQAAEGHAADAARLKWWCGAGCDPHTNPVTGSTSQTRIAAAGYHCPTTGENAFTSWGTGQFPPTPAGAVAWWLQSPGHRANMLSPNYTEIGIGVVPASAMPNSGSPGGTFVTDFGRGC